MASTSQTWIMSGGARLQRGINAFIQRQTMEGWSRDKKFSKMTGASREPPAYERRRLVCWNNKRVQTREALQYLTLGKYSRSTGFRFRDSIF